MPVKFVCPLIAVDDIAVSRRFYEQILGQQVKYDFGENVEFEGSFAIHLSTHYQNLLGDVQQYPMTWKHHTGELYFETDELEKTCSTLEQAQVTFIHPLREQPWGQRVVRVYDPDDHIVEIGESMESVVLRLHAQGLSVDEVCTKTGMPREFVIQTLP